MNLETVPRRSTLAAEIADRLRAQIMSGTWPVGDRIPTESELAAQLGTARNTIREAVRALAYTGLLEIRQGSGTYVTATSELAAVMQRRFANTPLRDVNEFRAALESTAAGLAATRRTTADLRRLERALTRRDQHWKEGDAARFADADATFHLTVVAAAHNQVITELYADLRTVVRDRIATELSGNLRPDKYVDHNRLVEAIRDKNVGRAVTEAAAHPHSWNRR